ncbi:Hypothetical protein NTJ_02203 [Nesidiocoris tenuis]|uniref:Uncharacterized protein n=1 Tax=Nesidiocoris tenuis TaxID=355587 RepID=A0ABN7AAQ0_9HEMI|nr:Hypothetical protein NTJ_02203 [Nesidiocoris tenuis]
MRKFRVPSAAPRVPAARMPSARSARGNCVPADSFDYAASGGENSPGVFGLREPPEAVTTPIRKSENF